MGDFGGFRARCGVVRFNVVNLGTKGQPMVVRLLSELPLGGSQNNSATLKIHIGRVEICVIGGPNALFVKAFELMDSKFNFESYGPNTGTTKICVG